MPTGAVQPAVVGRRRDAADMQIVATDRWWPCSNDGAMNEAGTSHDTRSETRAPLDASGGFGGPPPGPPGGGYGGPPGGGYGGPPGGGYGGPPGGGYGGPPPGPPPGGFGGPPPGPPAGGFGAPGPGFGPPPGQPPGYGGPGGDIEKRANTWFIASLVCAFTCCLPLGAIGAFFAHEGKKLAQNGDYHGAESKIGVARICGIIGIVGGVLVVLLYLGLAVAGTLL
jgi:hypothetical protein